jgi:hypothetical protein
MSNEKLVWLDESREGCAIETQEETAARLGVAVTTVQSWVRQYPDKYPVEVAWLHPSKLRYRAVEDVDAFVEWKKNKPRFRTTAEVRAGEVERQKRGLERSDRRVQKAKRELEEAQRENRRIKAQLKLSQEQASLLSKGEYEQPE